MSAQSANVNPHSDHRHGLPLANLATFTGVIALALFAMQQALRMPSGFGVEDALGWSNLDSVKAALTVWCGDDYGWIGAASYVLVDTAIFMPLYAVLLMAFGDRLRKWLEPGRARDARSWSYILSWAGGLSLVALLVVDSLENLEGALRFGVPKLSFFFALAAGMAFGITLWRLCILDERRWQGQGRNFTYLALTLFTVAMLLLVVLEAKPNACDEGISIEVNDAWAHRWKPLLIGLTTLPLILGTATWWFGAELHKSEQRELRNQRAALRSGAMGVIGRSRYVLVVLALFGVLTLGMDQFRDVLLGIIHVPTYSIGEYLKSAALLALAAFAVTLFSHACWTWARLVGMVSRPGVKSENMNVARAIGAFAQIWARVLSVMPQIMVCVLIAYVIGDSVLASRTQALSEAFNDSAKNDDHGMLARTIMLTFFTVISVVGGIIVIFIRRRLSLVSLEDYYNSETNVYGLIWNRSAIQAKAHAKHLQAMGVSAPLIQVVSPLFRPAVMPCVALLLMAVLRSIMFWFPETAASLPFGPALVLLAFIWWLGVLGMLSLFEQRHAKPWILVPLLAAGVLALFGWTDHHVLEPSLESKDELESLRQLGMAAMWVLVLFSLLAWCLTTIKQPVPNVGARKFIRLRHRWLIVVVGIVLANSAIGWLERDVPIKHISLDDRELAERQKRLYGSEGSTDGTKVEVDAAFSVAKQWAKSLPAARANDPGIFLIAAEGGGIRSAYWTAKILVKLHQKYPDFNLRTFLLSGVSGGAVGQAVYRACLRESRLDENRRIAKGLDPGELKLLADCVDHGFKDIDPLSPLIGGLFFEDVFGSLMPLSLFCKSPGCGLISRALLFEREWIRNFERLADPLSAKLGEPHLAFGSTWVESGNRTIAASIPITFHGFPAAASVLSCLMRQPSLIDAAHSSARFPYINPLATIRPFDGHGHEDVWQQNPDLHKPDVACLREGHLIDGGYFDNSGTATILDALRLVREVTPSEQRIQVILIRNGHDDPNCQVSNRGDPNPLCITKGVSGLGSSNQLAVAADKRKLGIYASHLGPLISLLNVSGIGSHGRHAAAELHAVIGSGREPCHRAKLTLFDQKNDGTLVPLGWYLSGPARQSLDAQVSGLKDSGEECH